MMRNDAPLYRERLARRASENENLDEQVHVAQLFHQVFGTPEGLKCLDYICMNLCNVDDVTLPAVHPVDPMALVDANARRNVGITIARLALMPQYDGTKPEVKG